LIYLWNEPSLQEIVIGVTFSGVLMCELIGRMYLITWSFFKSSVCGVIHGVIHHYSTVYTASHHTFIYCGMVDNLLLLKTKCLLTGFTLARHMYESDIHITISNISEVTYINDKIELISIY
jgi:hypothetical protein